MKYPKNILLYILLAITIGMCSIIIYILLFKPAVIPEFRVTSQGQVISAEQISSIVNEYIKQNPVINGKDAPAPSTEQIAQVVATYLQANPPPKGDTGTATNGTNGVDGSSCTTEQTDTGAVILCSNGTVAVINNGKNGEDGRTPLLQCNEIRNRWEIRYSEEENWTTINGKIIPCLVNQ